MAWLIGNDLKNDWLIGTSGVDVILGLGGNDALKGGGGADYLNGGDGSDTAIYADSSDSIHVDLTTGLGRRGTAEGDTLVSIENVIGSEYGDGLVGNAEANTLSGLSGPDYLYGKAGDDVLDGGYADDLLSGGSGADTLAGGEGRDWADYEGSPAGVLVSLIDHIAAGGDAQGDVLSGIEGLNGTTFSDLLMGDNGANSLTGYDGDDTLKGFGGDDVLHGGNGHDVLTGGKGADFLAGASGPDAFVWTSIDDTGTTTATSDRVGDFRRAEGDVLDLGGIDANIYAAGNQAFTFIGTAAFSGTPGEINYVQQDGQTIIQMQTGTSADVEGIIVIAELVTPEASWFVL
jgi:Ca2+-binding RTX toxin-like protein